MFTYRRPVISSTRSENSGNEDNLFYDKTYYDKRSSRRLNRVNGRFGNCCSIADKCYSTPVHVPKVN